MFVRAVLTSREIKIVPEILILVAWFMLANHFIKKKNEEKQELSHELFLAIINFETQCIIILSFLHKDITTRLCRNKRSANFAFGLIQNFEA